MRIEFKSRILLVLLVGILMSFVIFFAGCDPALGIKGIAYEWANAPLGATSQIYITNVVLGRDVEPILRSTLLNIPSDISKIPLGNVEIAVGNKQDIETRGDKYYRFKTTSNSTGEIDGFWIGTPGNPFRIRASKAGYMETLEDIDVRQGDGFNYVVVAILVRNDRQY